MRTIKTKGNMVYVPTTDVDKEMLRHMVEMFFIEIIESNRDLNISIGKKWDKYVEEPNEEGEIACKFYFQGKDGNYKHREVKAFVGGYYPKIYFSGWPFAELGIEIPSNIGVYSK